MFSMFNLRIFSRITFLGLVVFLSACSGLPNAYVYDGEDAGDVYLSMTNGSRMSEYADWGIQIVPEDVEHRKNMPGGIVVMTSSRIYGWAPPESQFDIIDSYEYGNILRFHKLKPGAYRLVSFNARNKLASSGVATIDSLFFPRLYDPIYVNGLGKWAKPLGLNQANAMPSIIFQVLPGVNYIGSFRAAIKDCPEPNFYQYCPVMSIEIRDKLERDMSIVDGKSKSIDGLKKVTASRAIKIDRKGSPLVYFVE